MNETDKVFFGLANDVVAQQADEILDHMLTQTRVWIGRRTEADEPADMRALISQLNGEMNRRDVAVFAMAAALWRLLGLKDDDV